MISGPIWLRDGDPDVQADFPEVGWVDVPVVALAAWAELQRLMVRAASGARPPAASWTALLFTVRVETAAWLVRCFEVRDQPLGAEHPVHEWKTGSSAFLATVVRAGRAVLAQCDERGWWSSETEALRRCLESGSQYRAG